MNNEHKLSYDIYDPSSSVSGDYWQLGTARTSMDKSDWQAISNCINQGLPEREDEAFRCKEPRPEYELWGCIKWCDYYWIYRHFLTGLDNFARPGRYFFVLLRLGSATELRDTVLSRLFANLEKQRGIPIDIEGLKYDMALRPLGLTDQVLGTLPSSSFGLDTVSRNISEIPDGAHIGWIIKDGALLRKYDDLPSPSQHINQPRKQQQEIEAPIMSNLKPISSQPNVKGPLEAPPGAKSNQRRSNKPGIFSHNTSTSISVVVMLLLISILALYKYYELKSSLGKDIRDMKESHNNEISILKQQLADEKNKNKDLRNELENAIAAKKYYLELLKQNNITIKQQ